MLSVFSDPRIPGLPAILYLHRRHQGAGYYLSHATAMHMHSLGPPRDGEVYVTSTRRFRISGFPRVRFHQVVYQPADMFGEAPLLRDGQQLWISDLERTILDGLKHPRYVGEFPTLVRGVAGRVADVDPQRLISYALRLDVDSVLRRLGYLLELCRLDDTVPRDDLSRLQRRIGVGYHVLDPARRGAGYRHPRWRLIINMDPALLEKEAAEAPLRRLRPPLATRRLRVRRAVKPVDPQQ